MDANATTNFAGLTVEAAVQQAQIVASVSPMVQARLACASDCNMDQSVTIDELISVAKIILGQNPLSTCPAADGNGDGRVTVDEIVDALSKNLSGCFTQ